MLAVDLVLLPRKDEQDRNKHDQRSLRGHVEAERKTEDGDGNLVQWNDEHVDDIAKEEPDPEMREHQLRGLVPVGFLVGRSIGLLRHGSLYPLAKICFCTRPRDTTVL